MHADFELTADGTVRTGPGGRREGAGRPKGYSPKEAELPDEYQSEATKRAIRKSDATIAKLEAEAQMAALKFEIESGNYLPRDAYREASATLLAEVAQAIRGLPDLLERKANLSPDQVVLCEKVIDDALATLSSGLAMFTEQQPSP